MAGPAANLERTQAEANLPSSAVRINENIASMFRYTPRTAALAASFRI